MQPKIRLFKYLLFFTIILWLPCLAYGQNRLLDKKITIQVAGEKIEKVLNRIEKLSGVSFSYNSDIIPGDSLVSFSCVNKSIEKTLPIFLGKDFSFKSTGKYIIILQKNNRQEINPTKSKFKVSGIVLDARTNIPLPLVTIYDMGSMVSAQSDFFLGNFDLTLVPKTNYLAIRCSKSGYHDSVVIINPALNQPLWFRLLPIEETLQKLNALSVSEVPLSDSAGIRIIGKFVNKELLVNSRNVVMYDKRIAQLSLFPKVGTNLHMSGAVTNHFSINLLGGYSYGVAGFEAGGIVNINKSNVDGFQVSCLVNLSGRDVNGFQASGLLNLTTGNVKGCQLSVISNFGADTVKGVQVAGIVNVCDKKLSGLQLSPVANISRGDETGAQVAGLVNYAANPRFQLGLINIADTSDGAPLGVINIIRHGYYAISFNVDELQTGYFNFSMGTRKLYSILGVSGSTANDQNSWGFNYGLGSHFMDKRRLGINVELLNSFINAFGSFDSTTISRVSLSTQFSLRMGKHFYLSAGPSVNAFIADADNADVDEFISTSLPKNNWHYSSANTRYDAWIGVYAGLKYRF
jgi:hypothetical protein